MELHLHLLNKNRNNCVKQVPEEAALVTRIKTSSHPPWNALWIGNYFISPALPLLCLSVMECNVMLELWLWLLSTAVPLIVKRCWAKLECNEWNYYAGVKGGRSGNHHQQVIGSAQNLSSRCQLVVPCTNNNIRDQIQENMSYFSITA